MVRKYWDEEKFNRALQSLASIAVEGTRYLLLHCPEFHLLGQSDQSVILSTRESCQEALQLIRAYRNLVLEDDHHWQTEGF